MEFAKTKAVASRGLAWALALAIVGAGGCSGRAMVAEPVEQRGAALLGACSDAPVQLSTGAEHTCALYAGGIIRCWGLNSYGELGDGTTSWSATPVAVAGLAGVTAVSAGGYHTCALLADQTVRCWGYNYYGQLGNGGTAQSSTPVAVQGLTGVVEIALGAEHTCARLADETVRCWGLDHHGQLGDGDGAPGHFSTFPVTVSGLTGVARLAAMTSGDHACAVLTDGTARCWGRNAEGQLGDGTLNDAPVPVQVVGLSGAQEIDVGSYHTCARLTGGTMRCWGRNNYGQLGDGTTTDATAPVTVPGVAGVVEVATGTHSTCARLAGGSAVCWGQNLYGELGNGTHVVSSTPTPVSGLAAATQIASGFSHVCALTSGGGPFCWGYNGSGQLGDGTMTDAPTPAAVTGLANATQLSAGDSFACARLSNGTARCWGYDLDGQLGRGVATGYVNPTPAAVAGLAGISQVSAGTYHTCAAMSDGTVRCWGQNGFGQLGDGTTTDSAAPVTVQGLTGVVEVTTGTYHSCARLAGGSAICWGYNGYGQLGDGTTGDSLTPFAVPGLAAVESIVAGGDQTCAVIGGGGLRCWGANGSGQLGDGTTNDSPNPVVVGGLGPVTAVVVGQTHTCALLSASGTVSCWGENENGELGTGTTADSLTPVPVPGLAGVLHLAAGFVETCAVLQTGSVSCWGWGAYGGLGSSTLGEYSTTPVAIPGVSNAVAVSVGSAHACALVASGAAHCWGSNYYGQIGNGAAIGDPTSGPVLCDLAAAGAADGTPCVGDADCASGACADGVCCAGACGGGDPTDCQACSVAAGGTADGVCAVLAGGTVCHASTSMCESTETCSGASAACPVPTVLPPATCTPVGTGIGVTVPLGGGLGVVGGMTVSFNGGVTAPGEIAVVSSGTGCPPPTGFEILPSASPHYWNIDTTAAFNPPIIVCINYDPAWVTAGPPPRLLHGSTNCGAGWLNITTSVNTATHVICGLVSSLSPFVLVGPATAEVADEQPPVLRGTPGNVVAYATSTAGAKVRYVVPTAVDDLDGRVPVSCAPASGATFAPGKTKVTCGASDAAGNTASATFQVWVQYQAPSGGAFFLRPIRPDGSSIFRVGRPVPVRFKLTGVSAGITHLPAKLVVTKLSNAVQGTAEDTSDESVDDTDLAFKYRPLLRLYAYRWKTSDQTQGTYRLRADLGDGVSHQIDLSLKRGR